MTGTLERKSPTQRRRMAAGGPAGEALALAAGSASFLAGAAGSWPLTALWPALLYLALRNTSAGRGAARGALWGLLTGCQIFLYGWAPLLAAVVLAGSAAAGAALGWLLAAHLRRLPAAVRPLPLPLTLLLLEVAVSWTPAGYTVSPAHAQGELLPFHQFMALAGLPGVTLLLTLAGCAAAELLASRAAPGAWLPAAAAAGLFGFAWGYGAERLRLPDDHPRLTVAAVAPSGGWQRAFGAYEREWRELLEEASRRGAQLVVWPEAAFLLVASLREEQIAWLGRQSRETGVAQVVGVWEPRGWRNALLAFDAGGELRLDYAKRNPLWLVEPLAPADNPPGSFRVQDVTVGGAICYDDCSADVPRALARRDAQLLAVPTNDWPSVARRHAAISRSAAVAFGLPVVRSTPGWCQVIDARGRVLAEAYHAPEAGPTLVVATVPVGEATPYARWGDWLFWLALPALGALLLYARERNRRGWL